MRVRVVSADPALARQGDWDGAEGAEGHGVWSISPAGRVSPGRLFHEVKAPRP